MRELTLNSCIMTYLSYNIQEEMSRSVKNTSYSVLDLPFPIAYQLVMSNHLKVANENEALSFIFNYLEQNKTSIGANLLSQALRYNFICFRKMLSAIRRNEQIRNSSVFVSRMRYELDCRVKIIQQNEKEQHRSFMRIEQNECQTQEQGVHNKRLYFNSLDINSQGRNKVSKETNIQTILDEVLQWVCTASNEA